VTTQFGDFGDFFIGIQLKDEELPQRLQLLSA
jgi:hypothetical protein